MTGSTGNIVINLSNVVNSSGGQSIYVTGHPESNDVPSGFRTTKSTLIRAYSKLRAEFDGSDGFVNNMATKKAIEYLDKEKVDLIHLHNSHDHYLNTEMILAYAKKKGVPLVWTLHDCWLLTGRCCSFEYVGCDKYQNGCGNCPHMDLYMKSVCVDKSSYFYKKKRDMVKEYSPYLVASSRWLQNLLMKNGYPDVDYLANPIDYSLFNDVNKSQLMLSLAKGRKILLSAASFLNDKKGLKQLVALSNDIDLRKYVLFGIGIDEKIKDVGSIIRINGSLTPKEMAGCYASSGLFINCTQEDNIPSVNIESIACGTPVVSYDVGGSKETIEEGVNGYIVPKNDKSAMLVAIDKAIKLKKNDNFANSIKPYDKNVAGKAYLDLYKRLISKSKGSTIK